MGKHESTAPLSTNNSPLGFFVFRLLLVFVEPIIPGCVVVTPDIPSFCGVLLPLALACDELIICIIWPMVTLLRAPTLEIESLGLIDTVLSALFTAAALPFPPFPVVGFWVLALYQQSLVACALLHMAHFSLSHFFPFPLESLPFWSDFPLFFPFSSL